TGEQEVTLVATNGCGSDTMVRTINVINSPEIQAGIDESRSVYACGATVISFTNDSEDADYYHWNFPGQSGYRFLNGTTDTSPEPIVEFAVGGTYNVYLTAGNACRESHWQTTIEVVGPPRVVLDSLPAVCDTTTIALREYLTISGEYDTLNWMIRGPTDVPVPTEDNPVLTFTMPGQYLIAVEAISAHCPNASDTTTLLLQTPQPLELSAPTIDAICTGSAPVALSSSLPGGIWSGPGVNDTTGIFDPALAGSGRHTIQYLAAHRACGETDTLALEVLPSEPIVVSDSLSACANDQALVLRASQEGGVWVGRGITDSLAGIFDPGLAGPGRFPLTYRLVNADNCLLTATVPARVRAVPTIEIPEAQRICVGQSDVTLDELFEPTVWPAGGSFTWTGDGVTQGQFRHQGEAGQHSFQLTYTVDGCAAQAPATLIVANPAPPVAAPQQSFCHSEASAQLQASPPGGHWSGPGLTDPTQGIISPHTLGSGTHSYTYTVDAGTPCAASIDVEVAIWDDAMVEAGANQ
ncbi:MAG: hypothetical protein D6772_08550, partial [Bacteroidetes bacterium]